MNWVISAASFWSSSWWASTAILFSVMKKEWSSTVSSMFPRRWVLCVRFFREENILSRILWKKRIHLAYRRKISHRNFSPNQCRSEKRSTTVLPESVRLSPKRSAIWQESTLLFRHRRCPVICWRICTGSLPILWSRWQKANSLLLFITMEMSRKSSHLFCSPTFPTIR